MALETATYPADLNTSNPTGSDPKSQLDDHIRMVKSVIKTWAAAPSFSAYQSTLQALSNGVAAKVQLQTEEWDTAGCFDNATNYRFTPTVPGYYDIKGAVGLNGSAALFYCSIYKNGAEVKRGNQYGSATSAGQVASVGAVVYLNGSTDYVELYVLQTGGALNTVATQPVTYFQAHLARLA